MNKENERKDFEDLREEILRVIDEHKIPIGISIAAGAAMIGGTIALLKFLEKKRGRPPQELEEITADLEEMVSNSTDPDGVDLPKNNLLVVAMAGEIGQIIESSDKDAVSILPRVSRAFDFPQAQSLRDEFLVASAAVTTFIQTLFASPKKEK